VLAALGGVAAEASFPAYFSAAKKLLASVDNYIVRSALVFVVVEFGFEVASVFVAVVEIEPELGVMTADSVTAEVVAVVSGAEAEVFG
jgi:hypothetical protein